MKTRHQKKPRPGVAARRNVTARTTTSSRTASRKDPNAIRPFHVTVPEADLAELRRRIKATKWPDRETVSDATQGVQLATIQALARYWGAEYDWRKVEARVPS
jgi:hypothetical protein